MRRLALAAAIATLALAVPAAAAGRVDSVALGSGLGRGELYWPEGKPAAVAFVNAPCEDMAARGFACFDAGRYFGDAIDGERWWEGSSKRIKAGIETLRRIPGVTRVVLFGHSGGAMLASFYQAVAERGVAYCQDARRIAKCDDSLAGLPKPDALILADAHPGMPTSLLRSINPSVTVDANGKRRVDPALDPFSPANGFNPDGESHYSVAFRERYTRAQATAINRLIDRALAESKDDDSLLVIPSGGNGATSGASLIPLDLQLPGIFTTHRPEKLLRNDGTISVQPIRSVARYTKRGPGAIPADERRGAVPDPRARARLNRSFAGLKVISARTFLSREAVRATDSMEAIDFCTSNGSPPCAIRSITSPTLIMAMGGYKFIGDDERLFDASAASDKDFVVIEGALHSFQPCTECEDVPGQYANTRRNMVDYMAKWARDRFAGAD